MRIFRNREGTGQGANAPGSHFLGGHRRSRLYRADILTVFLRGVKSFRHPAHNRIGDGQPHNMALMRAGNDDLPNLRRT
jgi:hypothetical protein